MNLILPCFAIIAIISAVGAVGVIPGDVFIFKETQLQGALTKVHVKEKFCVNLDSNWSNKVKSVRVSTATCILAFDDSDCQGATVRLENDTPEAKDLSEIRWSERISSLTRC